MKAFALADSCREFMRKYPHHFMSASDGIPDELKNPSNSLEKAQNIYSAFYKPIVALSDQSKSNTFLY